MDFRFLLCTALMCFQSCFAEIKVENKGTTMEHVKFTETVSHANSPNCLVHEYPTKNKDINIAVAEITDRYPDAGYAVNHTCTEMGYVLKGTGKLVTETQEVLLSMGDVVTIAAGEKYYWEGTMTLIVPATPAWYPEQHEVLDTANLVAQK